MSVSKKHKEVNEGLTNLLTHMKNDYNGWSMRGRTVHQNTEDFIRETEIREDMEKRYADGLGYEVNTKNFARGNILENDFRGVRWTGC